MTPRPLGNTGLCITPIGFGAVKIGRAVGLKYPQPFELPDVKTVEKLLNGVLDLGVTYIDTAPAYGLSEERIGAAIAHRRDEFVLSTKVGERFVDGRSLFDFSAKAVTASVEESLRRLRTPTVDIIFIHSDGNDLAIQRDTDCVAALQALKQRGLTRAIGLSGKTVEGARAALHWTDVLMSEYHLHDRSHEAVMTEARARGIGVVVKKALASGRLPAEDAVPFVLANPDVTSVVAGGLNLDHVRQNIALAQRVHLGGR